MSVPQNQVKRQRPAYCWRVIFPENRFTPRIKCGAGFFRITR
jgi:hypothetical protein